MTENHKPLFLSEAGELACDEHMPSPGSDTRIRGRWTFLTPHEASEFERDAGRPPACETCTAIARQRVGGAS